MTMPLAGSASTLDLGVELSNVCNLHCGHCIRGSRQAIVEHLDLALLGRVLDEAIAERDRVSVVFTGGEPLAAPSFADAVTALEIRGLPWRLVTNGWLVPRALPVLLRHRPEFVRISLSGASEASHDGQRGRGSWRRALLAVAVLAAHGVPVQLSMVLLRENLHELDDAVRLSSGLPVQELHFIPPQPTPESAANGSDLSPDEWDAVQDRMPRLAADSCIPVRLDYGARLPITGRTPCGPFAGRQVYVDAAGRVPFCCQLSRYGSGPEPVVGDLTTEPLSAILGRLAGEYAVAGAELTRRSQTDSSDRLDEYPCLSCARRAGRLGFLAGYPEHPWSALARSS
jgi:MoaA/NifB/PqqE/SkfB family radical SAM enzyme